MARYRIECRRYTSGIFYGAEFREYVSNGVYIGVAYVDDPAPFEGKSSFVVIDTQPEPVSVFDNPEAFGKFIQESSVKDILAELDSQNADAISDFSKFALALEEGRDNPRASLIEGLKARIKE